jgi:hypothetical protein
MLERRAENHALRTKALDVRICFRVQRGEYDLVLVAVEEVIEPRQHVGLSIH